MGDEYRYTAPADDTVALDSPIAESLLLNLDMNTDVVDVCESPQHSGDQIEDYSEKDVVLDSDDEGREQNEAINLVNGKSSPVIARFSGRDATGLLKRRQVPSGYFRRLCNKVTGRVFRHTDSPRNAMCNGESNAGRNCLYNGSRFEEHCVVMERASRSPDLKPIPTNTKEFHMDRQHPNMVRESPSEDALDERKLSSYESKSMDIQKDANYDCDLTEINYIESPEPAESHGKALDFVDRYLSLTDLGSYKDVGTRQTNRIRSPPPLRSKGSQSLAKRVSIGCCASKSMTFDWAEKLIEKDEYTSRRKNDSFFGFEGDKSGCLPVYQEPDNVILQKGMISGLQSEEKRPENVLSTNCLNRDSPNSDDIEKIESNSGICIAYDSTELDEQFDAELSRKNMEKGEQMRSAPDLLDIGMDTQMAAEAMEALVHAGPPMFDACFAHQGSSNTLLDSSGTVKVDSKSKDAAYPDEAFVGWRCKGKRSKCVKISTVQDKNASCSSAKQFKKRRTVAQLPASTNMMTEKPMTGKCLKSINPGDTRKMQSSKCGKPPGISVPQDEYGFTERESLKGFQKVHCVYGRRSKETTHRVQSDSPTKRRKVVSFHNDVREIGLAATCLKTDSGSSFKVKTETSKTDENSYLDVADRSLPQLNLWIYPKGKRSRQRVPLHSIRSSIQCSGPAATENNVEKYPVVNEEAHKRKLLVYTRRHKFSLDREHMGSSLRFTGELSSPSVNDNVVSDGQVENSVEFDRAKPLMQFGKLDDGKPSSLDPSGNVKSDALSNGHSMTLQVFEGSDKTKQSCNHVSRSPLMKELMRLGYAESLPDFLPKDSRRRKAKVKVCILFSQNLKTSILKQQRKIVARLGFSTVSCCSDATHFVTDKFVRTRNMLEAIALGKPVVTHLWLESCDQAGYVIDEKSYILRDEKKEKEIGFSMPLSLTRASRRPLLKGCRVLITANVKPSIDVINVLVKAAHGQVVQSTENVKTNLLILSCEEDYKICLPFLEKGASIYDSELLLNGIVTQKLEYERYQLFKDFRRKQPPSSGETAILS
ncbi:hypothetical protein Salat_2232600 [Sesamum alatum]|uniref:BRCT domain-containing protein n=1 Tax=Sesamum alatum TaxID=300844 RepID=A0AAE1XV77_9LAMI|nr:hypothetical protein Salat_2232600 [Sesamum alatum]